MFIKYYAPTDACAYRWPNQQCAIDHLGGEYRDVTTTKLTAVSKYPKSTVGILHKKKKWWMSTKNDRSWGSGWGVRVDVYKELKLL